MKNLKLVTIILAIVVVTMIAVFGIYIPTQNRMENKLKNYSYAMDLKGARTIKLEVNAEESEENKNKENYNKTKKIIEKRLSKLGVDNYIIKMDEQTGEIIVEIPEDDSTDSVVSVLGTIGKFEIIDSETEEVLMDNNDIKLSTVMYGSNSSTTTSSGTTVYLNIEFTKDGAKKLEDISNTYVKKEETDTESETDQAEENTTEVEENAESEEYNTESETTEKKITMKVDDEEIMSTSFEEPIKTGKLQLSVGSSSTDQETLQGYANQASNMAIVLDTGNIPVKYEVEENQYIVSDITRDNLHLVKYIVAGVVALALIVLVVRYKMYGVLGSVAYAGLISILLLLIRYTNVVLSLEGVFGIVVIMVLNYIFTNKLLSKLKEEKVNKETVKNAVKETYKEFFIKIVPILIAVITFCFIQWTPISSFGMVMFWGIALIGVYNIVITNNLLKINASK